MRGATAPAFITRSLSCTPSPVIFPKAHTACSATLREEDCNKAMKGGTAPSFTTATVCSEEHDAMLVKAHAASNCNCGLKNYKKQKIYLLISMVQLSCIE